MQQLNLPPCELDIKRNRVFDSLALKNNCK